MRAPSIAPLATALLGVVGLVPPDAWAVDTDGDSLDDVIERLLGTDPGLPDTDGDSLEDGPEVLTHDTDPLDVDTDGDTIPDGAEVVLIGTDPLADEGVCPELQAAVWPWWVNAAALADLDGDGDLDAATQGPESYRGVMHTFERVGAGRFEGPWRTDTNHGNGGALAVGDLDGDGDVDLVVEENNNGYISRLIAYHNDGTGRYDEARVLQGVDLLWYPSVIADTLAVSDVDGDGDADLHYGVYEGDFGTDNVMWAENTGVPGHYVSHEVEGGIEGASLHRLVDVDTDDDLDAVLYEGSSYFGAERLRWRPFDANQGMHGALIDIDAGMGSVSVLATVDVSGDGLPEIVVHIGGSLHAYRNTGTGFATSTQVLTGVAGKSVSLEVADLDGDGDEDLLRATEDQVGWIENLGGGQLGPERVLVSGVSGRIRHAGATVDLGGIPNLLVRAGEVLFVRNPIRDYDGDLLSTRAEVCISRTRPDRADTDGGGVDDRPELLRLTDPRFPGDDRSSLIP